MMVIGVAYIHLRSENGARAKRVSDAVRRSERIERPLYIEAQRRLSASHGKLIYKLLKIIDYGSTNYV